MPTRSATAVELLDAAGKTVSVLPMDGTPEFYFRDVLPGSYKLSFVPAADYIKPNDISVTLTGGQNVLAGAIKIASAGNASISGTIVPAAAAREVYIRSTSNGGIYFLLKPDPGTGRFSVGQIPADTYEINFTPASDFVRRASETVTVVKSQLVDIGQVIFTPLVNTGELSCKLNDTFTSWDTFNDNRNTSISVAYTSSALSIKGLRQSNAVRGLDGNSSSTEINIKLENVTGPGTYICDASTVSEMTYHYKAERIMFGLPPSSSKKEGGKATVIITAIDADTKTIAGSFTADLKVKSITGQIITHAMTDGVFKVKYP